MKKLLLIGILTLTAGGMTKAQQVISYVGSVTTSATNWTRTLEIPGFDSSLGTLTEVKLTFSGEVAQTFAWENTLPVSHHFSVLTTAELGLERLSEEPIFDFQGSDLNRSIGLGAFDGTIDFGGSSGTSLKNVFSFSGQFVDPSLSDYVANGMLAFEVSAFSDAKLRAGADAVRSAAGTASAVLAVEYTYAPFAAVPEPSAHATILGAGVLATVVILRRRTSQPTPA